MNAALSFLHLQGIKILSYLDDWLICAPSHERVAESTALTHINTQGLTVINEKCNFTPNQKFKFNTSVCGQHSSTPATIPVESIGESMNIPTTDGHARDVLRGDTVRPAVFKTTSSVVQQIPLGPQAGQTHQNPSDKGVLLYSVAVEKENLPDYRYPSQIEANRYISAVLNCCHIIFTTCG